MQGSLDVNVTLSSRVQPAEVLGRLRLTAGKAAELCGVSRRQLCYWTDKGIIPCRNGGRSPDAPRRIYDFAGLRKALMLKRLMDEGRGLRRAVRELKAHWVETLDSGAGDIEGSDERALLEQAERLSNLGRQARDLGPQPEKREALVRLALALQPLAELSQAACDGRVTFTGGSRTHDLRSLLSEAERTLSRVR